MLTMAALVWLKMQYKIQNNNNFNTINNNIFYLCHYLYYKYMFIFFKSHFKKTFYIVFSPVLLLNINDVLLNIFVKIHKNTFFFFQDKEKVQNHSIYLK